LGQAAAGEQPRDQELELGGGLLEERGHRSGAEPPRRAGGCLGQSALLGLRPVLCRRIGDGEDLRELRHDPPIEEFVQPGPPCDGTFPLKLRRGRRDGLPTIVPLPITDKLRRRLEEFAHHRRLAGAAEEEACERQREVVTTAHLSRPVAGEERRGAHLTDRGGECQRLDAGRPAVLIEAHLFAGLDVE
jgi:hypothetical protein